MKAEYINPFITGTIETLKMVTGLSMGIKGTAKVDSPMTTDGTMVAVGLTGEVKGVMVASMEDTAFKKITGIMMGGMPDDTKGSISKSAIGELFNIIMGTVATKLSALELVVDITPPTIIQGIDVNITTTPKEMLKLTLGDSETVFDIYLSIV